MDRPTLLTRTVRLLRDRPRELTLRKLADLTGESLSWIASLLADPPPKGPSVSKVEKLYNVLSPSPLFMEVIDEPTEHSA